MTEKFKYEFDTKLGILFKRYHGEITLKDITSSWDNAIKNDKIPQKTIGFILDYRKASFKLVNNEILGIPQYYRNNLPIFNGKRIAIITENPKDIIVPYLVKEEDFNYSSSPFSTIKAAINWILEGQK